MALTYGLKTPRDLLEKLKRDGDRLRGEVTPDDFFNFVVTAYSLCDWIENNSATTKSIKTGLQCFRQEANLKLCRDLANASKHFTLDPKKTPDPVLAESTSEQGYGAGRFDTGAWGAGEYQITIHKKDGSRLDGFEFAEKTLIDWTHFFSRHGL